MRQYIEVSPELRDKMCEIFNVSTTTIWRALNFLTNKRSCEVERHESIRKYALDNGGKMLVKSFIPNCKTETTKSYMVHTFPGGVVVSINLNTSHAEVMSHGEIVREEDNLDIRAWGDLLFEVQHMGAEL